MTIHEELPSASLLLSDGVAPESLVKVDRRSVSARILSDPEIFRLEQERIFARSWIFVAHASEVPNEGDFVSRYIGLDPVIVARGNGRVRVMLNSCQHRNSLVCQADHGNTKRFRCPYHGWSYRTDGTLAGVPWKEESFGSSFREEDFGLRQARVEVIHDLIFATWDLEGPDLRSSFGDFAFYLDIIFGSTDNGLEVCGPPQRWIVDGNWKLAADNFSGDGYHTSALHQCVVDLDLVKAEDIRAGRWAANVGDAGKGHGARCNNYMMRDKGPTPSIEDVAPIFGTPVELVPQVRRRLSEAQQKVFVLGHPQFGNLFPNFGFLNSSLATDPESGNVPLRTIRLWHPIGPDRMEVWSWALVFKDAPAQLKDKMRRNVVRSFSSSGMLEQDDAEVWHMIQKATKGVKGREQELTYMAHVPPDTEGKWPGPGTAYVGFAGEDLQWNFYLRWREMMGA